eukprot:NODE_424_length_8864_cov_0.190188.p7 type:complete len:126 gc:universal NODE_424_length_8864_cov_0.190188:4161-4538(+)
MTVRLRLARVGGKGNLYRIVASYIRSRRDGKHIEKLGTYDPVPKDEIKCVNLKVDRVKYWIGNGAQPSKAVSRLLSLAGLLPDFPLQRLMTKTEHDSHLELKKQRKEKIISIKKAKEERNPESKS